jgi:hypothetical protein
MYSSPKTSSQFLNSSGPPPCSSWESRYCLWHFRSLKLNNGSTFLYPSQQITFIVLAWNSPSVQNKLALQVILVMRRQAISSVFIPVLNNVRSWDVLLLVYQYTDGSDCIVALTHILHPLSFIKLWNKHLSYQYKYFVCWINACTILSLSSHLAVHKSLYMRV